MKQFKATVMIVDESPENTDILVRILKETYKLQTARNGELAMELAKSAVPPDLILLDTDMTGTSGYELCRKFKADDSTSNIPVIFVTAKDMKQDETHGFKVGAADFITKPVSPPVVHARVKTQLTISRVNLDLEQKVHEQRAKLEAVRAMVGGIAHDFTNVLQGLFLYSGLVKNQLPENKKLHQYFQHIINAGDQARVLVNQFHAFSRKETTDLQPTLIQYLLKDALKLTRAATQGRLEIIDNIDTNCRAVLCDPTQLHQGFVNLCTNASRAMTEAGGVLSVSLQEIEAQIATRPEESVTTGNKVIELVLSVAGPGFDVETLEQIFDPFVTSEDVDEGEQSGLWLGHSMIKDMQAQIEPESEPGKGTTLKILIPIQKNEYLRAEIHEEADTEGKGARVRFADDDEIISGASKYILEDKVSGVATVLVVDDSIENTDAISTILGTDYNVKTANNGMLALKIAQAKPHPDLILLDVMMPGMDGFDVARELQANDATKSIPIIFVTGEGTEDSIAKGFKAGGVDYVIKPFNAPELQARVETHLSLKAALEDRIRMSHKLGKYLSPSVYDSIFRGERDVRIESYRKVLTICFTDIVGFTSTAEGMNHHELTNWLNAYLDRMAEITLEYGGTLDKFIGDALMIFFGDPKSKGIEEDALNCIKMANAMIQSANEMGISIRVGITTGMCTIGNFGSKDRMDYTIIGKEVNVASRLESNAPKDRILISETTQEMIKDHGKCTLHGNVEMKGINREFDTYLVD